MYVRPTSMTPHAVFYDLINQLTSGRETSLGHQHIIREKNTREKSSWESKIKPGAVVFQAKPLINKRFFPRRGTVGLSPAILHFINNCYHEARQTRTKDGYQASCMINDKWIFWLHCELHHAVVLVASHDKKIQ